ncbi:MAG: ComF family protein [Microcoleaceae cyanobacterium]
MNRLIKLTLDLFLKPNCPLCHRPAEREVCSHCEKQILECGSSQNYRLQNRIPVFVWGKHDGSLKRAIATMKYQQHPEIARPLGFQLAVAWFKDAKTLPKDDVVVVPIPLSAEKQKQRGFNQAEQIARSFCQATGFPLKSQGLERVRSTQPQHKLSARQRQKNLKGAFKLGKDFQRGLSKKSVLLVDDIFTTGATVNTAIQVFQQAGIKVVGVVALSTTKKADSENGAASKILASPA